MDEFKSGDLLYFSNYGYVSTCVGLISNAPFTTVGMILRLPNKYDRLFLFIYFYYYGERW